MAMRLALPATRSLATAMVVEVAEAHDLVAGGVMAGRAHEGERNLAGNGGFGGEDGGPGGETGDFVDVFKVRSVGIEVVAGLDGMEVFGGMDAEEVGIGGRLGFEPGVVAGPETRDGGGDALGAFGMAKGGVVEAARGVDDDHRGGLYHVVCRRSNVPARCQP
jgi:hypothetical protein